MQLIRLEKKTIQQTAQARENFEGYFQGQVPDYAAGLIGTPQVDASQVQASFGRTDEALKMVNAFSGNTLNNIAFVFKKTEIDALNGQIIELAKGFGLCVPVNETVANQIRFLEAKNNIYKK